MNWSAITEEAKIEKGKWKISAAMRIGGWSGGHGTPCPTICDGARRGGIGAAGRSG
jgi:hypothetical protein